MIGYRVLDGASWAVSPHSRTTAASPSGLPASALHRLQASAPYHRAEHPGQDDGVIGVAKDRDEVRHQVDRDGLVGQQAHLGPYRQRPVTGQAPQQPQHIGQPQGLPEQGPAGADHQQGDVAVRHPARQPSLNTRLRVVGGRR